MSKHTEDSDEKTAVIDYLDSQYLDDSEAYERIRRRSIIRKAVDEIFRLKHFSNDPESVAWHNNEVENILTKMNAKIYPEVARTRKSPSKVAV